MKKNKPNSTEEKWKILLVDDDPEFLDIAKTFLEKQKKGLKVETVHSAEEGIQLIRDKEFDAIISDYKMPWITGVEFLKKLRESKGEIPFIIMTGRGGEDVAVEATSLRVDRYIKKEGKAVRLFEKLADEVIQTIEEKEKPDSEKLIAWIEVKSFTGSVLPKYDLKNLAKKIGFSIKKIEEHESPFNPKSADVIKTYTESFEEIPKSKSEEASEWRKKVMEDTGNLDADVIIEGKENTEKTQFLIELEETKWEEFSIKELVP